MRGFRVAPNSPFTTLYPLKVGKQERSLAPGDNSTSLNHCLIQRYHSKLISHVLVIFISQYFWKDYSHWNPVSVRV